MNLRKFLSVLILTTATSLALQICIYVIGGFVCEVIGIAASSSFCQFYFTVDAEDPLSTESNTTRKRWCLIWQDGKDKERGIRCMRGKTTLFSWLDGGHDRDAAGTGPGQVSVTPAANTLERVPEPTVSVPSVSEVRKFLPFIQLSEEALQPKLWVSRKRQPVELVIALSVHKTENSVNQLVSTLDSLFLGLSPVDQHRCLVLVCVTELVDDTYLEKLTSTLVVRYTVQIETGLMEIVVPREFFYASMFKDGAGDDSEEKIHRFRKRECMDLIYTMIFASKRGKYYLQLSQAAITRSGFFRSVRQALDDFSSRKWIMMRFASARMLGKLFRTSDLPHIVRYLSRLHLRKPAEYHVESYLRDRACGVKTGYGTGGAAEAHILQADCKRATGQISPQVEPVLFQYLPSDGPLPVQLKRFRVKGNNPIRVGPALQSVEVPGYAPCSTIRLTNDLLPVLFPGGGPYVIRGGTPGGRIDLQFTPPLQVFRLKLETGLPGQPKSSLGNGTQVWVFSSTLKKFTRIGHLGKNGDLEVTLAPDLQSVLVLEIVLGKLKPGQEVYLSKLTMTVMCRQSTRLHVSSTASISPSPYPGLPWHNLGPRQLPRREGSVLVSY